MKHLKTISLLLLTTISLTSCDLLSNVVSPSSSSDSESIESSDSSTIESESTPNESSDSSTIESESTPNESSGSTSREEIDGPITIDIFANGDQHGVVEANSSYASYPTYAAFIKETMSQYDYPILISNGDLWQGTYESNINYGNLLTACLDTVGYSCMTLGNHEFDWGQDVIRENAKLTDVPFLGANIVKYKNGRATDELVDYVEPYTIVDVGPLNVGIIGCIGPDQWSSITSIYVQDVYFLDPVNVIKEYSDELRTQKDCDIVIASFHAGTDDCTSWINSLGNTSSVSGLPYIDAAFTSHDHYYTTGKINGVVYANSGTKNAKLSHISLTYEDGKVTSSSASNLDTSSSSLKNYTEDKQVREIIDSYIDEDAKNKADEVEGSLSSSFGRYCDNSDNYGPRLAAKAMYEYTLEEGYDVCCAFVNDARAVLPSGNVTYSDILEAFPFFNNTIIMEVSGSVLKREVGYANYSVVYYAPEGFTISNNKTYTIAAYDYLAYHCNANTRQYNYFTSFTEIASLEKWPVDYISSYMNSFNRSITKSDFPDTNYNCIS